MKHSPGPFTAREKSVGYTEIKDANCKTIAVVRGQDDLPTHQADVALLGAAWDLLAAASEIARAFERMDTSSFSPLNRERIQQLDAAVQKALQAPLPVPEVAFPLLSNPRQQPPRTGQREARNAQEAR